MKITKLLIKDILGIREAEYNGDSVEIRGTNGTGKSSVIDAVRLALTNTCDRDVTVREGATEGEILLEFGNIRINRKFRTNKGDYKSVKEDGKEVLKPEAFLQHFFSPLQLNPVEFLSMSGQQQNKAILDLVDYKWDLDTIKGWFNELPPGVDYNANILEVLDQIQSENGHYYQKRQEINRDIKSNQNIIDTMLESLPQNFNPDKWREYSLADIYQSIEKDRSHNEKIQKAQSLKENYDNKIASFKAEKEIEITNIKNSIRDELTAQDTKIASLEAELRAAIDRRAKIGENEGDKIAVAESNYEAKISKHNEELKAFEEYIGKSEIDISNKQEEAQYAERMKSKLPDYDRLKTKMEENSNLCNESEKLTAKIELARKLPSDILNRSSLPLDNMTISDGVPLFNNLPVSNLSEGEKLNLCVDMAINNKDGLKVVLIDGIEKLSEGNKQLLYKKCEDSGMQFIATYTNNDDELSIITFD